MRFFALAVAVYCYLSPGLALAQDTARQLAGSWKLTSWTIQIIGGDVTEPFGRDPKGRTLMVYTGPFTIENDKFTTRSTYLGMSF